jgi:homocysteine S-methyltransferase
MTKVTFLERVRQAQPLLSDGAMGTMLHQQGNAIHACFDALNQIAPAAVCAVHRAYMDAGAEMIETNTFGANRYKLAKHGLADQTAAINRAGVVAAQDAIRQAGREDVYIAGSVGPLGVRLKPYGRVHPDDAKAAFAEQIRALAEAGVDVILLETFSDLMEELIALSAAREVAPHMPVICHMTFAGDDRTLLGDMPAKVARELKKAGADVIGVNCGGGPEQLSPGA